MSTLTWVSGIKIRSQTWEVSILPISLAHVIQTISIFHIDISSRATIFKSSAVEECVLLETRKTRDTARR